MPDQATVRRALRAREFVVVQEAFATTATCDYADLLLPATTWGEKNGTVTNSERRICRVRAGGAAAGRGARTTGASRSTSRAGSKRGCARGRADAVPLRRRRSGLERAPRIHARPRPRHHRPELRACSKPAPQQWPLPRRRSRPAARACTKTASSPPPTAARASPTRAYKPVAEPREARYPVLAQHRPPARPVARHEPHRHAGPPVRPRGRAGGADAPAGHGAPPAEGRRPGARHLAARLASCCRSQASTEVGLSQAFIAMHWGGEYLSGRSSTGEPLAGVNALTTLGLLPRFEAARAQARGREDPQGRAALVAAGRGLAAAGHGPAALRDDLRALMSRFPFASCVPFGAGDALEGAAGSARASCFAPRAHEAPPDARAGADRRPARPRRRRHPALRRRRARPAARGAPGARRRATRGSKASCWPATPAPRPGSRRCCRTSCRRRPTAACCCARAPRAPAAWRRAARQVCSCFGVTETAIGGAARSRARAPTSERLAALQGALKCGTNCGSCLPELKRMVRAQRDADGGWPNCHERHKRTRIAA